MAKRPSKKERSEPEPMQAQGVPSRFVPIPMSAILGQERALARLTDSMASGRVHHAWIFHGPAGVGKFTTALSFAGTLLDPGSRAGAGGLFELDVGGQTARLLASGTHPDLHIITRELAKFHPDRDVRELKQTNIPLDVVREFMLAAGGLQPMMGRGSRAGKVFIIDEAELLASAAQNAVLKFLEEPPARTVVILVTPSVDKLLPTIRSRCQRVFFAPLDATAMKKWLDRSGIEVGASERSWLLEFADGSPGVLRGALEVGLPAWLIAIDPMLDEAAKGRYNPEFGPLMAQLTDERADAEVRANPNLSKLAANRTAADWMLRLIGWRGRRLMREGNPAGVRWADAIRQAESEVDANVNLLFVFEKLACEMALGRAEGVEA